MDLYKDKDTIAAGRRHTIGLKLDGTVTAVGDNKCGQCDVNGWRGIKLPGNKFYNGTINSKT